MPDDPKALVQAFVEEVQNKGNIEGAQAIFSIIRAGFSDHDAVIHDQVNLLGALQQMGAA